MRLRAKADRYDVVLGLALVFSVACTGPVGPPGAPGGPPAGAVADRALRGAARRRGVVVSAVRELRRCARELRRSGVVGESCHFGIGARPRE